MTFPFCSTCGFEHRNEGVYANCTYANCIRHLADCVRTLLPLRDHLTPLRELTPPRALSNAEAASIKALYEIASMFGLGLATEPAEVVRVIRGRIVPEGSVRVADGKGGVTWTSPRPPERVFWAIWDALTKDWWAIGSEQPTIYADRDHAEAALKILEPRYRRGLEVRRVP